MDKHLDGGLKYSLNLDIPDTTLILHSTLCVAVMDSSPNLFQVQLTRPQNLVSNIEVIRNMQSKTSHGKLGQVDLCHILQKLLAGAEMHF